MSWQDERTMTGRQFKNIIRQLNLSQAGAGRFLGVSERTARRYVTGELTIHPPSAMLLRALLHYNERPKVPGRKEGWS